MEWGSLQAVFANEDPIDLPDLPSSSSSSSSDLVIFESAQYQSAVASTLRSDSEIFALIDSAFRRLGMPIPSPAKATDVSPFLGSPSATELKTVLPVFLLGNAFRNQRFVAWDQAWVQSYSDGMGRTAEYDFPINTSADPTFARESRIASLVASRPLTLPLAGFRIAIDPGHMGGDSWDKITGKFIKDAATGVKLSEGVMALQTSLLLQKEFEALGATVQLTHDQFDAVTPVKLEHLDLKEYGFKELRNSQADSWIGALAQKAGSEKELADLISKSAQYKRFFSEIMRGTYHTQRLDLHARNEKILAFVPDLTLVIHYDVAVTAANPNGPNRKGKQGVKAYIPGAFSESEISTPERRAHFLQALSRTSYFSENLRFAKHLTTSIASKLKIPFDLATTGLATSHGSGVQSRNLTLTHHMSQTVGAFLECAYYNTTDFDRFAKADYTLSIGGRKTTYSKRLVEVVQAIRDGVLNYVGSFSGPSLVK
ncbi:MAG: N-acetylmuramoyl-L-alanine amidase [Bdellovibrionales bacterium]|nr:N-acetylmuramoyl-L-alanine amidase [Bdellovibrionales bacterium]